MIFAIVFIFSLSFIVFIHELGHYWAARHCGVGVDAFSIGFGREIFGWNDKHGTRWRIGWLPLGGYVKLYGMFEIFTDKSQKQIDQASFNKAFDNKNFWQKAYIVIAGPLANFLLCIALFWGIFYSFGSVGLDPQIGTLAIDSKAQSFGFRDFDRMIAVNNHKVTDFQDFQSKIVSGLHQEQRVTVERAGGHVTDVIIPMQESIGGIENHFFGLTPYRLNVMDHIAEDSPAFNAGLLKGDRIIAVNDKVIRDFRELRLAITDIPDTDVVLRVMRDDQEMIVNMRVGSTIIQGNEVGFLGVMPASKINHYRYGPVEALWEGVDKTWEFTTMTVGALWRMVTNQAGPQDQIGGVVSITKVMYDSFSYGMIAYIKILAILSLTIGIFNLLPIPVLDGGHLTIFTIEAIIGRELSVNTKKSLFFIGFMGIIALTIFALYVDINRFF